MPRACIALGSNLGDRAANLAAVLKLLADRACLELVAVSSIRETAPVGGPPQPAYLNAAALLQTTIPPRSLLELLLDVEECLGRVRESAAPRWGPRTIDLDLLLYDELVLDEPGLVLPHPRLHLRRFVLEPLAEIAPEVRHPVLGLSVREILAGIE